MNLAVAACAVGLALSSRVMAQSGCSAGTAAAEGRRRLWRRQRRGHRPCRRHSLVRGTPHPHRPGRGHEHGRPHRRIVRQRHGRRRNPGDAARHQLGRDVRLLELRLQEHPPQGRREGLPLAPRVRTEEGHHDAHRAEQRRAGGPAHHAHHGAVLRRTDLRLAAHAVPGRGGRPQDRDSGGHRPRFARGRAARHDVAARRFSADRESTARCSWTAAR